MLRQRRRVFLLFIAATLVATAAALRAQVRQETPGGANAPTPIEEGRKSERQKKHGRLFGYSGEKLSDKAKKQTGDVEVIMHADTMRTVDPDAPKPDPTQFATCNADAIVVGTLTSKASQLTEDGSFIFTDYEMAVEEVLKDDAAAPVQTGGLITVTREGGEVSLRGRVLRAKRAGFKSAEVGGRYLLFLKRIPDTGSYLSYPNGSFLLGGERITPLGDSGGDVVGAKGLPALSDEIRAFAAQGCAQR